MSTDRQRLLRLARTRKFLSATRSSDSGIHSDQLTRLVAEGALERVARGRYPLAGAEITEPHGLVLAALVAPAGVICLLSALSFHVGVDPNLVLAR